MGIRVTTGPRLRIRCTGPERILSFFTTVDIPIKQVLTAQVTPHQRPMGPRLLGTGIPWLVALGRYKGEQGPEFWRVYRGSALLEITLTDTTYSRAVLQVRNPHELAGRITAARNGTG